MKSQALINSVKSYYPELSDSEEQKISEGIVYLEQHGTPQQIQKAESILKQILEFEPDIDTICTILIEGFSGDEEGLEEYYNETIKFLHENLQKLKNIKLRSDHEDSENIKRILIALSQDIRVLIVHLARYFWWLQNIYELEPERAEIAANAGLKIYAPIAEKLDMYFLKARIEDASFKILNPDLYKEIREATIENLQRENIITDAIEAIEKMLKENGVENARVEGRKKNIYSVHEKMKRKNFHRVKEVYDLFAVRIITKNTFECYQVLGQIHAHFTPMNNRFKDYIAVPKSNGYQSLHTTVLGLGSNTNPTEIQIQDEPMYQQARYGSAAHWAYKATRSSSYSTDFLEKNNWLSRGINLGESESEEIFDDISEKVNSERIHVFTPNGDIINLPKDATPIDFGYAIHSQVGESIVNAKVNGNIKSLNYELQSGDVVEVITKKGRKPNPLWLNFVKSSNARGKIKNYLNKSRKELAATTEKPEAEVKPEKKPKQSLRPLRFPKPKTVGTSKVMIGGETDIPFKMASCCKPKKHQPIIAYNSRGLEFVIHRQDCHLLDDLESERFMDAVFVKQATVEIFCSDRIGLLKEILEVIFREKINVLQSNIKYVEDKNVKVVILIEYAEVDQTRSLIEALKKVPNTKEIKLI